MDYQVNKYFKRSSTKSFTDLKETPVVLACIYNKNGVIITHNLLYSLFSPYGNVLRILIFEKLKVWKVFIEFDTVEGANNAKRSLDNFMLFDDGSRMNIYFSNLESIKFQNNNSGGMDYTLINKSKNFGISSPSGSLSSIDSIFLNQMKDDNSMDKHHSSIDDQTDKEDDIFKIIANSSKQQQNEPKNDYFENETDCEEPETDQFKAFLNNKPFLFNLKSTPNNNNNINNNTNKQTNNLFIPPLGIPTIQNFQPQQQDKFNIFKAEEEKKGFNLASNPILNNTSPILSGVIGQPSLLPGVQTPLQIHLPTQILPYGQSLPTLLSNPLPRVRPQENVLPKPPGLDNHEEDSDAHMISNFIKKIQADLEKLNLIDDNNIKMNQSPLVMDLMRDDFEKNYFDKYIKESDNINCFSEDQLKNIQNQFPNDLRLLNQNNLNFSNMNDLKNLDRPTLTQLYQNLSLLLGLSNTKSPVLYIRGLEHKDLKVHMIYNVFSNFGNILKIIYLRNKGAALIEFENTEYSTISRDYLNNIVFMGKPLRIYYSNYSMINLSKTTKDYLNEDILICNPKNFRFKKNKNVSINPPSATLHISNLLKEVCYEDIIRSYFSPFGRIESIKFLFMENNKNMCLIRMTSAEALNAMAFLHDTDLGGRKIQISFTRSKIQGRSSYLQVKQNIWPN